MVTAAHPHQPSRQPTLSILATPFCLLFLLSSSSPPIHLIDTKLPPNPPSHSFHRPIRSNFRLSQVKQYPAHSLTVAQTPSLRQLPFITNLQIQGQTPFKPVFLSQETHHAPHPYQLQLHTILQTFKMASALDSEPGSELFASYEADFKLVQADINQKLEQIAELAGEPKKAAIRAAQRAVEEADEIVSQMRIEVQNIPTNIRSKFSPRVRNYDHDLDKNKQSLKRAAAEADRQNIYGGKGPTGQDSVYEQRQQLLSGTERLERSSQRLQNSQRLAAETENIGAGILGDLYGQRSTLLHARENLLEGEGYVNKSVQTLRGMARRMATNRMITIAIITVLVLLIIAVIFNKFR
ncbi:hypothetical protein TWF281_009465 [Arthrobotrys megalospora]